MRRFYGLNEVDQLYIKGSSAALEWAEQVSGKGRLFGTGTSNGLLMSAEEDKRKLTRGSPNRNATLSSGKTLTHKKTVKGRRSSVNQTKLQPNCTLAVKPFLTLFILWEILHSSVICCFNTIPLHPPRYEVLIIRAGVRRNGLTSWLIALALSSQLRIKAAGHIYPAPSQHPRSLVYTSLGWSLLCIS